MDDPVLASAQLAKTTEADSHRADDRDGNSKPSDDDAARVSFKKAAGQGRYRANLSTAHLPRIGNRRPAIVNPRAAT
jgi:hypothetical protein